MQLTWVHLPIDFDFIGFHGLLDCFAQLAQPYIDSCFLRLAFSKQNKMWVGVTDPDASVRRCLNCLDEFLVRWVPY